MKELIRQYVQREVLRGEVTIQDDTELYTSGLVTSMGHIKLVHFLERTFQIPILMGDATISQFNTVAKIATFVDNKAHGGRNE